MAQRQSLIFHGTNFAFLVWLCLSWWSLEDLRPVSAKLKKGECRDFFFHIQTTKTNDSGVLVPAALYDISATYCPPTKYVSHRASTVQLLVNGANTNKHYWSALGPVGSGLDYQPYNYSWVDYARAEGYHVVAFDRLGTGNSSHPDPKYVRIPPQLQILVEITNALRQGRYLVGAPKCEKIIGVGHSLASILIGLILPTHPFLFDATLMTGFAVHFYTSPPSGQVHAPARTVFPSRFGDLDPGYMYLLNPRILYFSKDGEFDPAIPPLDYERADPQANGELSSILSLVLDPKVLSYFNISGTGFKGDIAILTGAEDVPFCHGDCNSGPDSYITQSLAYYASGKGHRAAFEIPKCGSWLPYHYVAREAFETAHNWLAESGY